MTKWPHLRWGRGGCGLQNPQNWNRFHYTYEIGQRRVWQVVIRWKRSCGGRAGARVSSWLNLHLQYCCLFSHNLTRPCPFPLQRHCVGVFIGRLKHLLDNVVVPEENKNTIVEIKKNLEDMGNHSQVRQQSYNTWFHHW